MKRKTNKTNKTTISTLTDAEINKLDYLVDMSFVPAFTPRQSGNTYISKSTLCWYVRTFAPCCGVTKEIPDFILDGIFKNLDFEFKHLKYERRPGVYEEFYGIRGNLCNEFHFNFGQKYSKFYEWLHSVHGYIVFFNYQSKDNHIITRDDIEVRVHYDGFAINMEDFV